MKKFAPIYDEITYGIGSAVCGCGDTFPIFPEDNARVVCPKCGQEMDNPFWKHQKARKKEKDGTNSKNSL